MFSNLSVFDDENHHHSNPSPPVHYMSAPGVMIGMEGDVLVAHPPAAHHGMYYDPHRGMNGGHHEMFNGSMAVLFYFIFFHFSNMGMCETH
jgi:hypothetical protein